MHGTSIWVDLIFQTFISNKITKSYWEVQLEDSGNSPTAGLLPETHGIPGKDSQDRAAPLCFQAGMSKVIFPDSYNMQINSKHSHWECQLSKKWLLSIT